MKVYIITFNNLELADDKVYLSKSQAEKEARRFADYMDNKSEELRAKSYSHFYAVAELELVFIERTSPTTLEEIYDL
jgi:hypothetical protein